MHAGKGHVLELILEDGCRYARVSCPANLIPGPGQYLLASDASDALLPVPLFYTDAAPQGFVASASMPVTWKPGDALSLRGPLGHGFTLPVAARRVGLVAFDGSPAYLRGLIRPALKQNALVVLVSDSVGDGLPDDVEVQPLSALEEILQWADYLALDARRRDLPRLKAALAAWNQHSALSEAQILIRTQMPCGGVAECGVCAVTAKSGWKMTCRDGPVFDLMEI
jgi:hypothetical protein